MTRLRQVLREPTSTSYKKGNKYEFKKGNRIGSKYRFKRGNRTGFKKGNKLAQKSFCCRGHDLAATRYGKRKECRLCRQWRNRDNYLNRIERGVNL